MSQIETSRKASHEYPWMVYTPDDIVFCQTEKDAYDYANDEIRCYCDDGWSDDVKQVLIAKVVATAAQTDLQHRPPEEEINEEGEDENGTYWGDFEYICNYKLQTFAEQAWPFIKQKVGDYLDKDDSYRDDYDGQKYTLIGCEVINTHDNEQKILVRFGIRENGELVEPDENCELDYRKWNFLEKELVANTWFPVGLPLYYWSK
jgi:hypothetical protein